jgi:oligopeptidase B
MMKSPFIRNRYRRGACLFASVLTLFFVFSSCAENKKEVQKLIPPLAEKINKELSIHGHARTDDYYWLNERDNPKVKEYLMAENAYKEAVMKHTEPLQQKLFDEIVGRIKKTDADVPTRDSGYWYYTRYEGESEYPVYCRKKGSAEAEEEVLLDVNMMAEGHDYYEVLDPTVSPDSQRIAFGVDTVSRRQYTLCFKDLITGDILRDRIPNTDGTAAWANDNKTVFYAVKDDTLRPYKIMKHVLGTDVSADKEMHHETDATFSATIHMTKSKEYIFIQSMQSILSREFRFLDADDPDGEFQVICPREKDLEYSVRHFKDMFYIKTNWNAKNYRLMETSVSKTGKENWKEIVPQRDDILLQDFEIFKDFLVIIEMSEAVPKIRIIRWDDRTEHTIDFEEDVYAVRISTDVKRFNPEYDTNLLRFEYTSLTTPVSTYNYNMKTREKRLLKQREVVGDFDPNKYITERLHAIAFDGTKIPLSLVYRKDLEKNGRNPCLLYGYGSYGYSEEPVFWSACLSLLDRGFVYAIGHIRGGSEKGRDWYDDGKLLKKKNTFADFISCAEHLIAEKYTRSEKLFALGGSAGGLLMGAVVNMRPDLFKGVIAEVPYVDAVTTMLDPSIPLTTDEYDEWGNPNKKEHYEYILSYSPYDNVEPKDYPAMLVTTGFHDSQVQYWEPAKWVAKLRALKTDDNILLLHTEMEGGHSGISGRFRIYRETALEFAFMLEQLGIKE